jgi:hypothetical protein
MNIHIRTMNMADLSAVHALQCRAHPDHYHEPVEALASRLVLGPDFCLVAVESAGVSPQGLPNGGVSASLSAYFLAHPWAGDPPPLHEALPGRLSEPAHYLFLHDMAVCPRRQGLALGSQLHDALLARAARHGFAELRLVAVGTARSYWQKLGFGECDGVGLHSSYGDAVLMRKLLVPQVLAGYSVSAA